MRSGRRSARTSRGPDPSGARPPAEAERITGVSTTLQRNWRRHGYLPGQDGHARFDVFALAKLNVLGMLAAAGVGPQQGIKSAELVAAGVVRFALLNRAAFEGDGELLSVEPNTPEEDEMLATIRERGGRTGRRTAPLVRSRRRVA